MADARSFPRGDSAVGLEADEGLATHLYTNDCRNECENYQRMKQIERIRRKDWKRWQR